MVNKKIILSMLTIFAVATLAAGTWAGFARDLDPIDDNTFNTGHLTFEAEGTLLMDADNENLLVPDADPVVPLTSTAITITNADDSVPIEGITLGLEEGDDSAGIAQYITVDSVTINGQNLTLGDHLSDYYGENTIVIPLTTVLNADDTADLVFNCHMDGDVPVDDIEANEALQDAAVTFSTTITGYQFASELP
jgi:hypothetical protein